MTPLADGEPFPDRDRRRPLLVGVAGTPHRGPATLAAELYAGLQGADRVRTHDVAAPHDAPTVFPAVAGQAPVPRTR
ncbi:hypothetical protein [Streptomyces sp. NPDC050856]|uniref:hypothetical protein n=1 Tax=Streptomyces sp. NPDC050856 TaxID=3154939 RepID=UPI0033E98409